LRRQVNDACFDRSVSDRGPACQSAWRIVLLPAPSVDIATRSRRIGFPNQDARSPRIGSVGLNISHDSQRSILIVQHIVRRAALGFVLGVCLADLATAAACDDLANALRDPGFERQTPADRHGWITFGGAFSPEYARRGRWSMLDAAAFGTAGSYQQLPAVPLRGSPAFGIIQVSVFDASGKDLGTVETVGQPFPALTSAPVDAGTPINTWTRLDTGTATAPAGAAFIQAFTLYIDSSGNYQRVFFDDLDLQVQGLTHEGYVASIALNAKVLGGAGLISEAQQEAMVEAAAESNAGRTCAEDD
jgi:hypothetical protein